MSGKSDTPYKAVPMGRRNWKGGMQYAIEAGNTYWIAQHMSERMAKRVVRLLNAEKAQPEVPT